MTKKHQCPACVADVRPKGFGSDRNCAFNADGTFTPDNWNCATIEAVLEGEAGELLGDDETGEIVPVSGDGERDGSNGWIILTRYKRRGCTSSAIHVGDFWPARPLTYDLAMSAIRARAAGAGEGGNGA